MTEQALEVIKDGNPGTLMRWATDVAGVSREIVMKTAVNIQGRKYVKVEGWQAIAVAHGCVASSKDVEKVQGGYRAIGEVRRMADGVLLSQAEGFIGEDEPTWFGGDVRGKILPKRADYAIRAMCQTRAISRACRSAFAHVVVLIDGNLSTTPAEEVPFEGFVDVETVHKPSTTNQGVSTPHPTANRPPQVKSDAPKAPVEVKPATEATRKWFMDKIPQGAVQAVLGYLIDKGWIMPNETLEDLPLHHVPTSTAAFTKFMGDVGEWELGESGLAPAQDPELVVNSDAPHHNEEWFNFPFPFGKNAGTILGKLEKNYLFGLWANYVVETSYNGKPKKPETIAKDTKLREMLDAAGRHYEFSKKD